MVNNSRLMIYIRIFLCVIISFVITGCSKDRETIIMVNNEKITYRQYRFLYENRLLLSGKKELSAEEKKEIFDDLINRELLKQRASKTKITVSDLDIKNRIDKMKERLGERGFQMELKRRNMTFEEFKKDIRNEILTGKFMELLGMEISVSDNEAETYYKEHAKDFMILPLYKVYIIKVFGKDEAQNMLARFKSSAESFDGWAIEKSPDDIRWINMRAQLTPETDFPEEMALMLKDMRVGDIGGPIRQKTGYFLFKLLEKEDARQKSFAEVVTDIRHLLLEEKKEAKINKYLKVLRAISKIEIKITG